MKPVSREEARKTLLDKLNRAAEDLHAGKDGRAAKAACADGAGRIRPSGRGSERERKNARRGRRKSLKTLNSDKEIQAFS